MQEAVLVGEITNLMRSSLDVIMQLEIPPGGISLKTLHKALDSWMIHQVMDITNGDRRLSRRLLQLDRRTLDKLVAKHSPKYVGRSKGRNTILD